jgi:hypothetical protein
MGIQADLDQTFESQKVEFLHENILKVVHPAQNLDADPDPDPGEGGGGG